MDIRIKCVYMKLCMIAISIFLKEIHEDSYFLSLPNQATLLSKT